MPLQISPPQAAKTLSKLALKSQGGKHCFKDTADGGTQTQIQSPGLGLVSLNQTTFTLGMSAWLRSERHFPYCERLSQDREKIQGQIGEDPKTHTSKAQLQCDFGKSSRTRRVDRFVTVALLPRVLPLLRLCDRTRIPSVGSLRSECVTRGPSTAEKRCSRSCTARRSEARSQTAGARGNPETLRHRPHFLFPCTKYAAIPPRQPPPREYAVAQTCSARGTRK